MLRRGWAARTQLARLVAVVAVLAGLAMLAAPRCADGMILDMPGAPAGSVGSGTAPSTTAPAMGSAMAAVMAGEADHSVAEVRVWGGSTGLVAGPAAGSDSGDMGGLLATCLALLVVALVALVGLARPRAWRTIAAPLAPVSRAMRDALPAPSAGLARLCVLRT
jgi:hypothetical protein